MNSSEFSISGFNRHTNGSRSDKGKNHKYSENRVDRTDKGKKHYSPIERKSCLIKEKTIPVTEVRYFVSVWITP